MLYTSKFQAYVTKPKGSMETTRYNDMTNVLRMSSFFKDVETRHFGEVAKKISLLKDLSGRKVKNQGGGRNGRKN